MALTDESHNGFFMPVAPAYGGGYGNNGGGFFGGDWAWIILLLLIGGGGWGMGGFGMGGMWPMMMGAGMNGFGLDYLYPWLNNSQHISDGFRDQQLQSSINGLQNSVTSGFGDVQLGIAGVNQNICQTGNTITGAINNGFSAAEIAANGRQMANMQQNFGLQTSMLQGFNGVQSGIADAKYVEATEACATRTASAQNTRDIIDATNRTGQAILDKLCALELDGVKGQLAQAQRDNVALQNQINMANMQIGFNNETDALYNRLKNCPVPSVPVYGSQPIFTCGGNAVGCGCGAVA